jgi:hypothetical protein
MIGLSPMVRKSAALLLTTALLFGIVAVILMPIFHASIQGITNVQDARFLRDRLATRANALGRIDGKAIDTRWQAALPYLFDVTSAAQASPEISGTLRSRLSASAVSIDTLAETPGVPDRHNRKILKMVIRGTEAQIRSAIMSLEQAQPVAFIQTARLTTNADSTELRAELDVAVFWRERAIP